LSGVGAAASPTDRVKRVPVRGGSIAEGAAPALCAPLTGRTVEALCAEATALLAQGPDLLEWRVDHLDPFAQGDAVAVAAVALREVLAAAVPGAVARVPLLVTLRAAREGGVDRGLDDVQRAQRLADFVRAGHADLVDLEAASDPAALAVLRAACRDARVPLLLSAHDFGRTPPVDEMVAVFARMASLGADVAKLAVMPRSEADVAALLEATAQADRTLAIPLISMSMGELGVQSRVIGHRSGSRITWGSGLAASAPGQLPLSALRRSVEESLRP
jgi:3-dehydroquinate dehydratase-1